MDVNSMFEGLNVGMIVADANFKITHINERGRGILKAALNAENLIGKDIQGCHSPATQEKLQQLFQDFRENKKGLDYDVMETPVGKWTKVYVPYFDGNNFAGVVEFVFESALG